MHRKSPLLSFSLLSSLSSSLCSLTILPPFPWSTRRSLKNQEEVADATTLCLTIAHAMSNEPFALEGPSILLNLKLASSSSRKKTQSSGRLSLSRQQNASHWVKVPQAGENPFWCTHGVLPHGPRLRVIRWPTSTMTWTMIWPKATVLLSTKSRPLLSPPRLCPLNPLPQRERLVRSNIWPSRPCGIMSLNRPRVTPPPDLHLSPCRPTTARIPRHTLRLHVIFQHIILPTDGLATRTTLLLSTLRGRTPDVQRPCLRAPQLDLQPSLQRSPHRPSFPLDRGASPQKVLAPLIAPPAARDYRIHAYSRRPRYLRLSRPKSQPTTTLYPTISTGTMHIVPLSRTKSSKTGRYTPGVRDPILGTPLPRLIRRCLTPNHEGPSPLQVGHNQSLLTLPTRLTSPRNLTRRNPL